MHAIWCNRWRRSDEAEGHVDYKLRLLLGCSLYTQCDSHDRSPLNTAASISYRGIAIVDGLSVLWKCRGKGKCCYRRPQVLQDRDGCRLRGWRSIGTRQNPKWISEAFRARHHPFHLKPKRGKSLQSGQTARPQGPWLHEGRVLAKNLLKHKVIRVCLPQGPFCLPSTLIPIKLCKSNKTIHKLD